MRKEFRSIVSLDDKVTSLKGDWPAWTEKLLKVAQIESSSRPALNKMIEGLKSTTDVDNIDGN